MEMQVYLQRILFPFAVDVVRLCLWFVLLLVIFVPLERLWSLHAMKVFRKGFLADSIYYFLSSLSPKILLIVPLSVMAWATHRLTDSAFYETVADLPWALRYVAALVVGEIGFYWGHRWTHEIPFLWRFHAIHHSAEEIDWLVNTRAHPVDLVFTRLCGYIPMYALGLAQPTGDSVDVMPLLVTITGIIWGFFIHANLRWRLGWFEWLLATPAFHHWHHTNDGPAVINKNYAAMLPWVDKCFGTFYLPKKWPEKYGTDSIIAPGIVGQLLDPLVQAPAQREPAEVAGKVPSSVQ